MFLPNCGTTWEKVSQSMDNALVQGLVSGSIAATDTLSPFGLFLQADIVVKAVMLVLLLASVISWAIIFEKWRRMRRLNRDANTFEELFWSAASLEELETQTRRQERDPMSCVFREAMLELQGSFGSGTLQDANAREALQSRVERVMTVEAGRWMDRIERHMIFLASVGSVSPFIGLFGTVWGIMNSFAAIAASKQTNLAVVAPGIAEALFATALGLVAAIPAVVAYNKFSNDINRYGARLDGLVADVVTVTSRDLSEVG